MADLNIYEASIGVDEWLAVAIDEQEPVALFTEHTYALEFAKMFPTRYPEAGIDWIVDETERKSYTAAPHVHTYEAVGDGTAVCADANCRAARVEPPTDLTSHDSHSEVQS